MLKREPSSASRYLDWLYLIGIVTIALIQLSWKPAAAQTSTPQDAEALLIGKASMSIRASVADLEEAKALQDKLAGDVLWVRRNGQEYVIRDTATLESAHALFSRQAEIGREQREIGERQRQLGKQQRAIGQEQTRIGRMQRDVGVRRQTDRAEGEPDQIEPEPGPRGEEQRRLKAEQDRLGEQQASLGAEQHELGARQQELGAERAKLSHGLEDRFRVLVDEALAKGLGQPTRHLGSQHSAR